MNTNTLTETKPYISYPNDLDLIIKKISLGTKKEDDSTRADPYGSYIYRLQKWPADVDLYEVMDSFKTSGDAVNYFVTKIKSIIRGLNKKLLFSELKAGLDEAYNIELGSLINGIFHIDKNLKNNLYNAYKKNLFTLDEYSSLDEAIKNNNSNPKTGSLNYDYINNLIREKRVLRWTKEEIIRGYKIIRKKRVSLRDAIKDNTMIKIDYIFLNNGKYVEITNLMFLSYREVSKEGIQYYSVGLSWKDLFRSELLQKEIEKFYYSDKYYNPFKMCKRMFSFMRNKRNYEYLNQLKGLLAGEVSLLYQIKSELEIILLVIERVYRPQMEIINNMLQEIKLRLNYVLNISRNEIIIFSQEIDRITELYDKKEKLKKIKELKEKIVIIINYLTIKELNKSGLIPLPNFFLPDNNKYNRSIIRRPEDNPNKIYNEYIDKIVFYEDRDN